MKVLSLFDGMSCGQIALKQLGIVPEVYYASEIDKHAIKQTQLNFPDTIQLGDVTKWKDWDIDWKSIDLVLAGSPCQGFSFAGKQLAFEDPRSKLFFVFIDILNHIKSVNPDVLFLLENVNMKKSHLRIISEYCGVFPVNINSNLVSAQNRNRWYWTNIRTKQVGWFGEMYSDIPQPEDRGIFLRDILESEVDEKYYIKSPKMLDHIQKEWRNKKKFTQINGDKAITVLTRQYPSWSGNYVCVAMRGREGACLTPNRTEYGKSICKDYEAGKITEKGSQANGMTLVKGILNTAKKQPYQQDRIYDINGISPALLANMSSGTHAIMDGRIRRLTPIECARLQTVPSWYKWDCSDMQIYKMLGNGWTVDVIVHILSYMKEKLILT